MKSISIILLCALGIMGACLPSEHDIDITSEDVITTADTFPTLLFVGNSLTYTNDIPKLVKQIAASKNIKIKSEMLALPNYALVDHLADGKLQTLIQKNKYRYVIVQQGPSSQADGKALLFEAGNTLKALCEANKSKLAFFMVWPAHANYWTFDGVIANYAEAANKYNAILCPVGKAWKEYIDSTNDLSYYGSDLFHPSAKGSQVAAEIIFASLFK